ncbi:NXPE family member 1-like [Gastrophryne carolinensis]
MCTDISSDSQYLAIELGSSSTEQTETSRMIGVTKKHRVMFFACTILVVSGYVARRTFIQFSRCDFEIKNLPSSWRLVGSTITAMEAETTEQEITNLMTFINNTIPQIEFEFINETSSALHSSATIVTDKPQYCVGDTLVVRVEMFNYLRKRKTYGGDFLRARIGSPPLNAGASGRIWDFNNGSYNVYFTLYWAGRVELSIRLMHPSEGAAVLWKARNLGYEYITYTGKFLNGTQDVHTQCGFYLDSREQTCDYEDKKYREVFYCIKLPGVPCGAFISLMSSKSPRTYLSDLHRGLFTRSKIAVEIPKQVAQIEVQKCSNTLVNVAPRCQAGLSPSFPGGHFLQNQWFPATCNLTSFQPLSQVHTCLTGKMIYLMGDSTLRQWLEFFLKVLPDLKLLDTRESGWHRKHLAYDSKNKLYIEWKKHGHPFVTDSFFTVRDHSYISGEIDRLAGGPGTAVVFSLGQHFRPFPLRLFIRRILGIRKAIENLLLRSPETKVVLKSENPRNINLDVERFSDFHGYVQYLAVRRVFAGLYLSVIDAWDMSTAFGSYQLHPEDVIVKNQINLFLSYIC